MTDLIDALSFTDLIDLIYAGEWPYNIRRNKMEEKQWEVFHHSDAEIVSPVVDHRYSDREAAQLMAAVRNKNLLMTKAAQWYAK